MAPRHNFRFKNPLYSLDASTINLCQSVFPWTNFRSTKSAIKLHVGLSHSGYLPEFVTIIKSKTSDVEIGRTLQFLQGSIVVIYRGYNDYSWYNCLTERKISFITRLKVNTKFKVINRKSVLNPDFPLELFKVRKREWI